MKVDKNLFCCNDNPIYYEFWPRVSKFYKEYYDIDSKLFFLGEKNERNEKFLTEDYGEVEFVKPLENIPIIIQVLWGKFWFAQKEPETTWWINDLDMFFLNKQYVLNSLKDVDENSYAHLCPKLYRWACMYDQFKKQNPQLPEYEWWRPQIVTKDEKEVTLIFHPGLMGWLHFAKGKNFKKYLDLSDDFADDCNYIFNSNRYGLGFVQESLGLVNEYSPCDRLDHINDARFICCEEILSTERLFYGENRIVEKDIPIEKEKYICEPIEYHRFGKKVPKDYDISKIFDPKFKKEYYYLHGLRPYEDFKEKIEKILSHYN